MPLLRLSRTSHLGEILHRVSSPSEICARANFVCSYTWCYSLPIDCQCSCSSTRDHLYWKRLVASPPPLRQAAHSYLSVLHPAGNVAEHLVAAGLARVVDWHAGILAAGGGMERLRAAEKTAKERRAYLYANAPAPGISRTGSASGGPAKAFDATVTRIWSGDQISIVDKDGKERRLQLSSTRGPK